MQIILPQSHKFMVSRFLPPTDAYPVCTVFTLPHTALKTPHPLIPLSTNQFRLTAVRVPGLGVEYRPLLRLRDSHVVFKT